GGGSRGTSWRFLEGKKDIVRASRHKSQVARQQQIHRLRHIIKELCDKLPSGEHDDPLVREMRGFGCRTTMHLVNLLAPRLDGDDYTKDLDFARASIARRWEAGLADAKRAVAAQPWR